MTSSKLLSIIIPCYNEEEVIGETLKRLKALCVELYDFEIEMIFINDGSRDRTDELLRCEAASDSRVKLIVFARNFGHQIAISAGINTAIGDAIVLIDADLQDPPEVIHEMIAKWREGYDVVYGRRVIRPGETYFKRGTAKIFYRILNKLSDIPIPLDTGDFRLMDRKVVDVLKKMPEKARFVRGMVSWVGFKQYALPYKRMERFAGESKYPLRKMLHFALDGILSFSTKPLQIAISLGIISSVIALGLLIYTFYLKIFTADTLPGWSALMVTTLFIGGIQLIVLGLLGEYIGRIYNETKNRPLYVVQEYVGFKNFEINKKDDNV
jgi:dolichol-phosphate mannosyltransferase